MDTKRSWVDGSKHSMSSPSGSQHTPIPSSRPSPMPFCTQPLHSPDSRHTESHYPTSPPQLAVVLLPHPRPIGPGHALNIIGLFSISRTTTSGHEVKAFIGESQAFKMVKFNSLRILLSHRESCTCSHQFNS
ncbi:uncharacterized protein EDB93DRAFT_1144059 [Suillus bovinus]|uniref:uncharacterized protein n=1 Tax=Suillus bovinus TaxID=48563 RepID=UPI001B86772F|nr:uncharacterized protein EDB93DRAFT_1144059 [Suillus bovinus]KAG2148644.1 hypothetical protein EDB93DRAFT_1144059 [Suillus bovinus]